MRTPKEQYLRSLPFWTSMAIWLAAILSPTVYVAAVIWLSHLHVPAPPVWFVVVLSCLIPVAALIVSSIVVWLSQVKRGWRVGWLVLTAVAISFQIGVLHLTIVSAITAAISLP
jgi:hypothetical protein